jgi:cyclase
VYDHKAGKCLRKNPDRYAAELVEQGAGELVVNSVDRDGTMQGFDLELIKSVSDAVNAPVIACGGAGSLEDLRKAILAGASAVAAGSLFIYAGEGQGVLVNYPSRKELQKLFEPRSNN